MRKKNNRQAKKDDGEKKFFSPFDTHSPIVDAAAAAHYACSAKERFRSGTRV
jgi:hypothetical protein